MMTFRGERLKDLALPTGTVWLIADIAEVKQAPQLLKAFRDDLVPTEAEVARREGRSYESASDLLARIRTAQPSHDGQESVSRRKIRSHSRRPTAKVRKA